jgi:DNA-binding CsgD family transcriptional regulator
MNSRDAEEAGLAAYHRRDWSRARRLLQAARASGDLSGDGWSALADSAWWLGLIDEAVQGYEQAFQRFLTEQRPRTAAFGAIGLGVIMSMRGEGARGSGWFSRAFRLLEEEPECVEHGYMLVMGMESALGDCDLDTAIAKAHEIRAMGRRFGDKTLNALAALGEGRALIKLGRVDAGMALLDEAMLAALDDDLDPSFTGNIYCSTMIACHEVFDLRRAGEWTRATARWCEGLQAAGPFLGICRVHRAQILQIHGAWDQAELDAKRACQELAHFDVSTVAEGHYRVGEIRRVRGDLAGAEAAYRRAHELGRDPQPGLALLRLAQGQPDAARASIRSALAAAARDRLARVRHCVAQVAIAIDTGDLDAARAASDELAEAAQLFRTSGIEAAATQARGEVLAAEGHPAEALPALREAVARWQALDAPYEAARVRVVLGRAYRAVGDVDTARREFDAAREVFARLGATLDLRILDSLEARRALPGDLSAREAEVLRLVAAGMTNREIAAALVISPKTVARHLANIFAKLNVSTRAAAAAFAVEHHLVTRSNG